MKKSWIFILIFVILLIGVVLISSVNLDLNHDGNITISDIQLLASHYQEKMAYNSSFDLNNDSEIDLFDIVSVARQVNLSSGRGSGGGGNNSFSSGSFHEPSGMTTVFNMSGGTKDWSTACENGAAITFYGSKWGNPSEGSTGPFTGQVSVVSDSNAPYGHAVQVDYPSGSGPGFQGMAVAHFGGPWRELYIRAIFEYNPTWQQNQGGGTKIFYYGTNSMSSAFFPLGNGDTWRTRWVDQYSGSNTSLNTQANPLLYFPPGSYHTIEILQVTENSTSASNGWMKMWLDGNLVSWEALGPSITGNISLSQPKWDFSNGDELNTAELGSYWGGSTGIMTHDNWMRWGQIYVSGKN